MGYRNPITSAAAVDTGRGPSDAGVRLYQDTSVPAVPQGVAEWRTGTMDRNATVKLAGGGSGGSAFILDGGATELIDAPRIGLDVETLPGPGAGYGPVLRLIANSTEGGQIMQDVATNLLRPRTAPGYPNPTFFGPFGASSYDDAYYELDADGYVNLGGLVKGKTAGTWPGNTALIQLPAGCRPAKTHLFGVVTSQSTYGAAVLQLDPAGNLTWIAAQPGWSYVAGSWIALDGIRFRAEQ